MQKMLKTLYDAWRKAADEAEVLHQKHEMIQSDSSYDAYEAAYVNAQEFFTLFSEQAKKKTGIEPIALRAICTFCKNEIETILNTI